MLIGLIEKLALLCGSLRKRLLLQFFRKNVALIFSSIIKGNFQCHLFNQLL